ncbi:MAG: hypothetical protein QOE42_1311, partial [Chloroflexota bacterium]|nr:hypothetical protein [Chloroflexota bacterium]
MPRPTSIYVCSACGQISPRWEGRCPGCAEWNTLVEEARPAPAAAPGARGARGARGGHGVRVEPIALGDVDAVEHERLRTGIGELDNVLG